MADFKIRLEKENAPRYLYLEGTMPASENGTETVPTNLPPDSIITVDILTETSAGVWVPDNFETSVEFFYNWWVDSNSDVKIQLHITSSGSITNKKYKMMVTYRI